MKTKEIGGVLYKLVPEEKKLSCEGCAFKDPDAGICTFLSKNCNKGLIYKKVDEPISTSNLKPFNLEAAKAGKPVCTRNGRKARIICFDRVDAKPILALIASTDEKGEDVFDYFASGKRIANAVESDLDLMMLHEKKEGWVNVYKRENEYICKNECNVSTGIAVYKSEGEAKRNIDKNEIYVNTIKITWEE